MTDVCVITKLAEDRFFRLIDSIFSFTAKKTLDSLNLLVCYTGDSDSEQQRIESYLKLVRHAVIRRPYHFAKNSNELAGLGMGETLLFVNDDVELKTDAITHCAELAQAPNAGTVGIKLLHPDRTIQHAGQTCYLSRETKTFIGVSHFLVDQPDRRMGDDFVFGNTGAFLMMSRKTFFRLGGFDEAFKSCFEDVWLNVKALIEGKYNVCCASQYGIHNESTTRKQYCEKEDVYRLHYYMNSVSPLLYDKSSFINTIFLTETKYR